MGSSQQKLGSEPRRGLLARPLDALVFLLPLLAFYEVASLTYPDRVIAFDLMRRFFELFGEVGMLAPGLAVVIILLTTHVASREAWTVHWRRVGWMYLEAAFLAVPLFALNMATSLASGGTTEPPLVGQLALGVGAGIYEELVFRLMLISIFVMIGVDFFRLDRTRVAFAAVLLSSLAFAAHHHQPIGVEQFDLMRFVFRTIAGIYLAVVFWYRGYGPAAGCHAAYNVALVSLAAMEPAAV